MLSFLRQETEEDSLGLEKRRLEKARKQLERQSAELEARLNGKYTPPPPPPKPQKKKAHFTPDPEDLFFAEEKTLKQKERLKIEKRMARNRVIILSVVALLLLFWVGKILIF